MRRAAVLLACAAVDAAVTPSNSSSALTFLTNPLASSVGFDGPNQCYPGQCTLCEKHCTWPCWELQVDEWRHCLMCGKATMMAHGCAPHAAEAARIVSGELSGSALLVERADRRSYFRIMMLDDERRADSRLVGDAIRGDQMLQRLVLWILSLIADVFVIWYHVSHTQHPKWTTTKVVYNVSLIAHIISGSTECILGPFIFFLAPGNARLVLMVFFLTMSMVHMVTAVFQTPRVFGQRKVMVPAYLIAVILKFVCWCNLVSSLHRGPYRDMQWFMSIVNVHHIYAWVRDCPKRKL